MNYDFIWRPMMVPNSKANAFYLQRGMYLANTCIILNDFVKNADLPWWFFFQTLHGLRHYELSLSEDC